MSEDPIRRYSDAVKEFDNAYRRIREIGTIVSDVSHYLNNKPHTFTISNIDVNFPTDIGLARDVFTLDAKNWPSAKEIAEAIVDLYNKRERLKKVWDSLSTTDKSLVNAPNTQE